MQKYFNFKDLEDKQFNVGQKQNIDKSGAAEHFGALCVESWKVTPNCRNFSCCRQILHRKDMKCTVLALEK